MAMLDPIGSCNDAGVGRLILEREHELAELAAAAQEGRARWCSSPGRPGSASRAWSRRPQRPTELANRTGTSPRYVEEWLRGQAAGGYVEYHPADGTYSLTEEQAFVLTNPPGPVFASGAFQLALGALRAEPQITQAFRTGEGVGWHQHDAEVFVGANGSSGPDTAPT
jgi:hypothetical protein